MAYRKKTLRSMSPTTRKLARLIGELESVERRLKNILPEIKDHEFDSQALQSSMKGQIEPQATEEVDWGEGQIEPQATELALPPKG